MRRVHRLLLSSAGLLLAALTLSCFDAPVRQGLRIFFNADGTVEVHAATTIQADWVDTEQSGVRDRLDQVRDEILRGEDLWARAFRAMEPRRERVTTDYEEGLLAGATRQALVEDPTAVEKLFAETPVGAYVEREGDTFMLELVPGGARNATRSQRNQVEAALERFAVSVAAYMEALAAVYERLEESPEAAEEALASLLGIDFDGEPEGLAADLRELLEETEERGGAVWEVLEIKSDAAYTPDELSRLVYDPFPSPVFVEIPGPAMEVEGFLPAEGGGYATRTHSLWDALDSLRGRWVEPVPLVEMVATLRSEESADDVDEDALLQQVLSIPRAVRHVPTPGEVKAALVEEMTPPDLYRLRWTLPARP